MNKNPDFQTTAQHDVVPAVPARGRTLFSGAVRGESPRWDKDTLWFSDIFGQKVYHISMDGSIMNEIPLKTKPSGLGILADGSVLISSGDCTLLRWNPVTKQTAVVADLSSFGLGVNDMTVDTLGRSYIGCYQFDICAFEPGMTPKGSIVLVTPGGKAVTVADDLLCPNGMVITPDGQTLIVADTMARELVSYQITADGHLTKRQCRASLPWGPDGIGLDETGAVWAALPDGGIVARILPGGRMTHQIRTETTPLACAVQGNTVAVVTVPVSHGKIETDLCNPQVENQSGSSKIELFDIRPEGGKN